MKNTLLNFILFSIIFIFSSITKKSSIIRLQIHKEKQRKDFSTTQKIKYSKQAFAFHTLFFLI